MPAGKLHIGLLVPASSLYPALGEQVSAGMQAWFAQPEAELPGAAVVISSEAIGLGQSRIEPAAYALLGRQAADLLVGLLHSGTAPLLHPALAQFGRVLVAANLGENIPRSSERHGLAYQHSLGLWQASLALGQWAALHAGTRGFLGLSFYDSGYDLHVAFRQGFEAAGGTVLRNYLSHLPRDPGDFPAFFAHIEELQPDFVYLSVCGDIARQFQTAWAASPYAGRIPLLGLPFLCADPINQTDAAAWGHLTTCTPWDAVLFESSGFAAAYRQQTGQPPDIFGLLGYETAQLISAAWASAGGDPLQLATTLNQTTWRSPRGALTMHHEHQSSVPTLLLHTITAATRHTEPWDQPALTADDPLCADIRHSLRSGWINPYLCI